MADEVSVTSKLDHLWWFLIIYVNFFNKHTTTLKIGAYFDKTNQKTVKFKHISGHILIKRCTFMSFLSVSVLSIEGTCKTRNFYVMGVEHAIVGRDIRIPMHTNYDKDRCRCWSSSLPGKAPLITPVLLICFCLKVSHMVTWLFPR